MLTFKALVLATTVTMIAIALTPSDITAITIASSALIAAIFTGIVNIITALRMERKVDQNTTLTNGIVDDAKVIREHVNSATTEAAKREAAVRAELQATQTAAALREEALRKEVQIVRELLAEKKETAALLAQSVVQPKVVVVPASVEVKEPPTETP